MSVFLTHAYFLEDDVKEQQIMRPYPPLGLLYIGTFLEHHGIATEIFDTTFSSRYKLQERLLQVNPPVLGLYVNLMTKLNVLQIMAFAKEKLPATRIVLGGPEVTHHAEKFLRHGADAIVIGEGEETMLALATALCTDSTPYPDLSSIDGVAFLKDGMVVKTPARVKLRDLDTLPVPDRKKIDLHLYLDAWKKRHGKNAISVSTMRGCPYTCKWCSRAVYGLSYRRRSPEKVAAELHQIKLEYNPDSLWFVDDVFTISHKWLAAFRDEVIRLDAVIPYECITRADRLNESVMRVLKDSGCFRVWIGAESGSQKVIDLMDRRVDVHQVRDMIRLARRHGIETGTFIMLGYPGETEEDIEETIRHLKTANPDHFTITVAYPIKGTELYEEVEALQTTNLPWESSTDRQIDFKRAYSRRYYDYAVRRVINEVNFFKAGESDAATRLKLKTKSLLAKAGMRWHRGRSGTDG